MLCYVNIPKLKYFADNKLNESQMKSSPFERTLHSILSPFSIYSFRPLAPPPASPPLPSPATKKKRFIFCRRFVKTLSDLA